ncbi:MAG: hypothetical protein ACOYOU_06270, partial [Kiritimatiellia bacterium]
MSPSSSPWSFPDASQFIQPPRRQDAKVAKTNKFDVSACGETTSGKLGALGVLAVKNAAYVVLQEKTMSSSHDGAKTPYGVTTNGL